MAQVTVCDRCKRSPNGLKPVLATFGIAGHINDGEPNEERWPVEFMCPACRETAKDRIAAAMAPPVKRKKASETLVDAETPGDA